GGLADDLDDADLLRCVGALEDHVEAGLLLGRGSRSARRAGHDDRAAGGGLDAVGVLEILAELDGVLEGEAGQLVTEFLDGRHGKSVLLLLWLTARRAVLPGHAL